VKRNRRSTQLTDVPQGTVITVACPDTQHDEASLKASLPVGRRVDREELLRQIDFVSNNPIINGMLASIGGMMAVLNESRQVLAVNDRFLELLGADDPAGLLGLWPGDTLRCAHSADSSEGCGSAQFCEACGAGIVIATALATDLPVEKKCVLTAARGDTTVDLCLQVRGVTITLAGGRFVLVFLQDITEQELHGALQRSFFHDIRNSVMGLGNTLDLISCHGGEISAGMFDRIRRLTGNLVREVKIQSSLAMDSFGDMEARLVPLKVQQVVEEVEETFSCHPAGRGKTLRVVAGNQETVIVSDLSLVVRVVGNMIINAFEATAAGGEILLRVEESDDAVVFRVWNDAPIAKETAVRIFQHFYSTKEGSGRGLGTYSMKVFGEKLLAGKVGFTSSAADGTWFNFSLPKGGVTA